MAILQELTRRQVIAFSTVALIILIAASTVIYSCSHPHVYPQDLVVADSLCDSNPDSAVVLLDRISIASYSDDARWYLRLLRLKQKIKCSATFDNAKEAFSRMSFILLCIFAALKII